MEKRKNQAYAGFSRSRLTSQRKGLRASNRTLKAIRSALLPYVRRRHCSAQVRRARRGCARNRSFQIQGRSLAVVSSKAQVRPCTITIEIQKLSMGIGIQ